MLFFNKKHEPITVETPKEVVLAKTRAKKASEKASTNTKQLKELLLANGITLKIHIATGGKHGH